MSGKTSIILENKNLKKIPMADKDWKDRLNELATNNVEVNKSINNQKEPGKTNIPKLKHQDIIIRFEKRNGKPATIVSNYDGSESELKELAKKLKIHCGTGGSAKDDEILIQGDVRKKVVIFLREMGYKVRGNI